jgi:hypothetical protein
MDPNWSQGAEPPPARKSGSKVWLIVGVGLGICVLLCCGGVVAFFVYAGSQVANMMSTDPTVIRTSTAEIAAIDVPADIPPKFRFDVGFAGQRHSLLVYYVAPGSDNQVWLAASGNALAPMRDQPDQLRIQLESQLDQQTQTAQTQPMKSLSGTTSREVEITVNGKASKINVVEGTDSTGKKLTQADGMFEGKTGPTLIKMQLESDKYPPEKIDAILKSIK